jgi:hypothetical protein
MSLQINVIRIKEKKDSFWELAVKLTSIDRKDSIIQSVVVNINGDIPEEIFDIQDAPYIGSFQVKNIGPF